MENKLSIFKKGDEVVLISEKPFYSALKPGDTSRVNSIRYDYSTKEFQITLDYLFQTVMESQLVSYEIYNSPLGRALREK